MGFLVCHVGAAGSELPGIPEALPRPRRHAALRRLWGLTESRLDLSALPRPGNGSGDIAGHWSRARRRSHAASTEGPLPGSCEATSRGFVKSPLSPKVPPLRELGPIIPRVADTNWSGRDRRAARTCVRTDRISLTPGKAGTSPPSRMLASERSGPVVRSLGTAIRCDQRQSRSPTAHRQR